MVRHDLSTIAVVGASLAGLRAAETLRSEGFAGHLVLVGAEPHLPYDRPPLSKQFLAGTWGFERVQLRDRAKIDALGLDLCLGHRAVSLDAQARRIELDDGGTISYDGLVVATGAHPRRPPGTDGMGGVHTLRTVDDARALSADLGEGGARVVVVGAGFIGSEVAATCLGRGAQVTVVETLPVPLGRVLGEEMGAACAALHIDHGVALRTGVALSAVHGDGGRVRAVELTDGTVLDADVVVIGIGVTPTTDWLAGSGVPVDDGVVTDPRLFAADGVVAAGDVARWQDATSGEYRRIEHWTNAAEQAVVAARNLLAGPDAAVGYEPVPYFWSDQYDVKIQVLGDPRPDDTVVVVDGSVDERRFVALYGRGGMLRAVVGFNRPRQLMAYRPLLERRAGFDEALSYRPG